MSYERLAYDDQDTTVKMHTDCTAATSEMGVPDQRVFEASVSPRDMHKPEIPVSDATANLASRLHLHLD